MTSNILPCSIEIAHLDVYIWKSEIGWKFSSVGDSKQGAPKQIRDWTNYVVAWQLPQILVSQRLDIAGSLLGGSEVSRVNRCQERCEILGCCLDAQNWLIKNTPNNDLDHGDVVCIYIYIFFFTLIFYEQKVGASFQISS